MNEARSVRQDSDTESEAKPPSPLTTLKVFKDQPLFGSLDSETESDAFNHEAFANTIFKLIQRNPPPLSIGLFGSWGIGKSTIINILFNNLKHEEPDGFTPIYFNAWKYSGDSFRRQFLIEVARQVHGPDNDEVARLVRLNYVDVLKTSKSLADSLAQAFRDAVSAKLVFRSSAIVRFLLGCISLLVIAVIASFISNYHQWLATVLLTTTGPAIFIWFSQIKFEDLIVFQEAPLYDPKLIFPEQFEKEFSQLVRCEAVKGKKIVVAIDDLDRCEPATVRDVLISMKNFIGQENCFFVVPCDDKTIVTVFNEPNQKQGYSDESLRKYFNVVLRIPPITSTDLVDFANTTARKIGISEDIVQVAVLANCRDARKMKHFLNSLAMKYQIAKAREAADLMPHIVDENLLELAKAVLIEDAYPEIFGRIVENPRVYQALERAALGREEDTIELKGLKLENWQIDYPGLKEVLERTRDIPMIHADVFFSLKSTNPEVKIPRGTELKAAIIDGNLDAVSDITKDIADEDARTATADLLVDLLIKSTGRFLQRSITGALKVCDARLFSGSDERRVATAVSSALLYRDTIGILTQPPRSVLNAAELSGGSRVREVLDRYHKALSDLKAPAPPPTLQALVPNIYLYTQEPRRFADVINGKFLDWIKTREGLTVLDKLAVPPESLPDEKIPSPQLVKVVLDGITAEVSEVSNNEIRRNIVFSNWSHEFGPALTRVLTTILQNAQSVPSYSPEMSFAITSIIANHHLVETAEANALWAQLPPLFQRINDASGKEEIGKAAAIFALFAKDASIRSAATNFILSYWQSMGDPALRQRLQFVKAAQSPESEQLIRKGVEQELNAALSERQSPTDRTAERIAFCIEHKGLLPSSGVEDLLIQALEVDQDQAFTRWTEIIRVSSGSLNPQMPDKIASRALDLSRANTHRPPRAQQLLSLFSEMLPRLQPERRRALKEQYLDLLKDSNANLRNAAAAVLQLVRSSLGDPHEFKIPLANLIGDLNRDLRTPELLQYRPVLEAILANSDLFGDIDWKEIAALSRRLMSQNDLSFQDFGLLVAEKIPPEAQLPKEDILHLLIALEGSPQFAERAGRKLDQFATASLTDTEKDKIASRRTKPEAEA